MELFGVTCTCSWLELFVVIWSWVKNDAAPFLGVGGLVGGYAICQHFSVRDNGGTASDNRDIRNYAAFW